MDKTSEGGFKATLSLFDATAIGVGSIIGGGIFVVTGIVAGLAGSALVVSIVLAAIISLFTALSFARLTAWLPREGSVYEFAYRLLSPSVGFLSGWMWIVSNIFAAAAVSLGFAHYFVALVPMFDVRIVAAILCVGFTVINYAGIKHSAMLNNMLVSAKVTILLFFVLVGVFHADPTNFVPFAPSRIGIFYGTYFIFFAFTGFARVAVVSEEVKNAKNTVPKAIILALAISTVIYIAVGAVAVGLVNAEILGKSSSPLALAIGTLGNPFLVYFVSLGGMLATASVLLTSILGLSRMFFAMARKKDLPQSLNKLHPRYNTPYISIIIAGLFITILTLFVDLAGVVGVSTFASIFYYALANASALRLKSNVKFRQKAVPAIGLATCLMLLAFVNLTSLLIGVASLLIGALYYYGKKRSQEKAVSYA